MITYKKVKDKIVICKDGVYMSFTNEQLSELTLLIEKAKMDDDFDVDYLKSIDAI